MGLNIFKLILEKIYEIKIKREFYIKVISFEVVWLQ